jgi:hypothetical protein
MSQQNDVRHCVNCQITAKSTVTSAAAKKLTVPTQKRKEDAKKTLYLNRI